MRRALLPLMMLSLCALLAFPAHADTEGSQPGTFTAMEPDGTYDQVQGDINYTGTGAQGDNGCNYSALSITLKTSSKEADPSERSAAGGAGQGQSGETGKTVSEASITGPVSENTHY